MVNPTPPNARFQIHTAIKYHFLLLLLTSCSSLRTHQTHYGGTDTLLRLGQPQAALQQIQAHTPPKKDRLLHLLDLGMLQHWSAQYNQSNQTLEQARILLEKQRTQSITSIPRRLLINDNATDYTSQDSEEIYLHIFKALNWNLTVQERSNHV